MKKRSIVILADGSKRWIGGLYYNKNIAFELLQNDRITEKYEICVYAADDNKYVFNNLPDEIKVRYFKNTESKIGKICRRIALWIDNAKYIYPVAGEIPGTISVAWFPDFQHKKYPSYFKDEDLGKRDDLVNRIIDKNGMLVLSSKDSYNDFKEYYTEYQKVKVCIVPFVSYILPEIRSINKSIEVTTLSKFGLSLSDKYAVIMNQFWQHKNHIVVLEAMKKYYSLNADSKLKFVFTGNLDDYRNHKYVEKVKALFEEPGIKEHAILLGFIDRKEQISIMKNAEFVIQPSLFEGWGTVVEDAKVLDKTILLSDIPVHREQKNEKCILFDPHDPESLAELISNENEKEHKDDVNKGVEDMYKRAKEYSKGFEQILEGME